jgi:hypothetical protein
VTAPAVDLIGSRGNVAPVRRVLVLFLLLGACESDASPEARMFLDRVERLDLDDPPEERRRLIENLATMPLSHSEVTETRDVCVDAHRSMLEAEELRVEAVALLARCGSACGGEPSGAEIPSTTEQLRARRDLDQNIRRADRALERSRDLFSRCHRQTRTLDTRYRRRRR